MTSDRLKDELRKVIALRREAQIAEAAASRAKQAVVEQERAIHDLMEAEGQKSGTFDLGPGLHHVRVTRPKPTVYARVIDKDVALASIQDAGRMEEMFDSTIRKAPANQWVRECLENGEELPDGFDFSSSQNLTITIKKGD